MGTPKDDPLRELANWFDDQLRKHGINREGRGNVIPFKPKDGPR